MVGFHTRIGRKQDVDAMIRVIEELLAPNGINTLIMEFYGYSYECYPQYATGSENKTEATVYAMKRVDQMPAKGIIHKNKAARLKSQLARKLNAAQ